MLAGGPEIPAQQQQSPREAFLDLGTERRVVPTSASACSRSATLAAMSAPKC